MARGRGPKGRRGGASSGAAGVRGTPITLAIRTAKPAVQTLPSALVLNPTHESVPPLLEKTLREENGIYNAQTFFSALERIQPEVATHGRLDRCWCGVPSETITSFTCDEEDGFLCTLGLSGEPAPLPIFLKRVHIIDPITAMEGECVWPREGALPAPSELWLNTLDKLNDPMNEGYVDAVFALLADRLVTSGTSPHWCRCFGTFPARAEKYMYNISEEYPSFRNKSFWTRNQRLGLFSLHREDFSETGTVRGVLHGDLHGDHQPERTAPLFSEDAAMDLSDFETVEVADTNTGGTPEATETTAVIVEDVGDVGDIDEAPLSVNRPAVRIRKIQQDKGVSDEEESSNNSDGDDTDDTDDYADMYAEFSDFPVQVTLLERVEGTLDELLDQHFDEAHWTAWMFQVIAGLACAQYWFGFVHNDLHSQNVMWSKTDQTHLTYRVHSTKTGKQTFYRVPTFGYIMKIIDFGRASFTLPEPAGFFISDAFYPGHDAGQQYNCEPFYDARNGKKIEPNPSFDLSRLAVSMLETLWPTRPANATPIKIASREGPKSYAETVSPLYNMLWEWLTDDAGKNILRTPSGEERYPEFDLYNAIAADVHRAVPHQQIEKPIFMEYRKEGEVQPEGPVYDLYV